MLLLVRNYTPAHEKIINSKWDVAPVARDSYDIKGKVIGTVGAGVCHVTAATKVGVRHAEKLEDMLAA